MEFLHFMYEREYLLVILLTLSEYTGRKSNCFFVPFSFMCEVTVNVVGRNVTTGL